MAYYLPTQSGLFYDGTDYYIATEGGVFKTPAAGPEPSTDVFVLNLTDEISQGMRVQTAAKLGGVLVE